jgi:hypothetical protein
MRGIAESMLVALAEAGLVVVPRTVGGDPPDYATSDDCRSGGWEWHGGAVWLDLEVEDGLVTTYVRGEGTRSWQDPIDACVYLAATLARCPGSLPGLPGFPNAP